MNRISKVTLLGISDGLSRGLLIFFLGEYIVSDMGGHSYVSCFIAAVIFATLSIVFNFLLSMRVESKLYKFYVAGIVSFLLSILILLVNYVGLHLCIFPRRELTNGDGIILLLSYAIFLALSEVGRIVIVVFTMVLKK